MAASGAFDFACSVGAIGCIQAAVAEARATAHSPDIAHSRRNQTDTSAAEGSPSAVR